MVPRSHALFLSLLALAGPLPAQEPLDPPAPLVAKAAAAPTPGGIIYQLEAARSAHDLGLPALSVSLYRDILAKSASAGPARVEVTLALVTALLDDGDSVAAEQALQSIASPRGSQWHLRAGLIHAYQKKLEPARAEILEIKPQELATGDLSWWYFLQGMASNIAGDSTRSLGFYEQATQNAGSEMARARFYLAETQARLKLGTVRESDLEQVRANMDRNQGRALGYIFAQEYAIMLDAFGQKDRALAELQRQLRALPPQERWAGDDFRLLLGLIAGPTDSAGRDALNQLLTSGSDAGKQRVALQMLAAASLREAQRPDFRKRLKTLIAAKPTPQILEELLLVSARLALADRTSDGLKEAVEGANELLQKFPGSQMKSSAYGVLASAAWEQRRYRTAADFAEKARVDLPPGQARAELGVLVAEAWYRAGDFRSAAEAYSGVLREVPVAISPGDLRFQRVQAEIKAAQADTAQQSARLIAVQSMVDELANDPAFGVENRWRIEWNLARVLLVAGQTEAAYARLNRLLATSEARTPNFPEELRSRMAWLQARLSLDAGQFEQTIKLTDAFLSSSSDKLPPDLRTAIFSEVLLLKVRANFSLSHPEAALEAIGRIRKEFPRSDAAATAYIVEADFYIQKDQLVDAQKLLTRLAEDPELKDNPNAPYALYRAAQLASQRGQSEEANGLIEKLIKDYPGNELVFSARREQGDLLRKRLDFAPAQRAYDSIIAAFPQHPELVYAQLALADTHAAQAQSDPTHGERAAELYEGLLARPGAPADLRIEAGYKLGLALMRRGDVARAQEIWWKDLAHAFLIDQPSVAAQLSSGLYWLSRALTELGDSLEKQGKLEEAKAAWLQVVNANLPEPDPARERLARYNVSLTPVEPAKP